MTQHSLALVYNISYILGLISAHNRSNIIHFSLTEHASLNHLYYCREAKGLKCLWSSR